MHRIDTGTVDEDEFGTGKDGFTGGDPGSGIAPTDLSADWCDDVQETLAQFIEGEGISLEKRTFTQLVAAVESRLSRASLQNMQRIASVLTVAINATAGDASGDPSTGSERVWVSVGSGGKAAASDDGQAWIAETTGVSDTLTGIASDGNGTFVAVGFNGAIATRTFGGTWTVRTSGVAENLQDVVYDQSHSVWIAVGANGTVLTSTNGASWTARTSGTSESLISCDAAASGHVKACGTNGTILRSTDGGVSWSADTSGLAEDLNEVRHSDAEGYWLCTGSIGGLVRVDTEGTTWSSVAHNLSAPRGLATNRQSIWVTVDDLNRARYSVDGGKTWSDCGWAQDLRATAVSFDLGVWSIGAGDVFGDLVRSQGV